MAQMNYLVESKGQKPKETARTFLRKKGLLK
ncbi:MAG: hypothetical protein ACLVI9_05865 [Anaerostipes hadrus]